MVRIAQIIFESDLLGFQNLVGLTLMNIYIYKALING